MSPILLLLDNPSGRWNQFTREELWQILQDCTGRKPTVLLVNT